MKKTICGLLLAILALTALTLTPATAVGDTAGITVLIDGGILNIEQPPVLVEGRTLVPLRAVFEALGATVEWNGATQTVTAGKDDVLIQLTVGQNVLYKNGEQIVLDVPAMLLNDKTMIPIRAVSEAFGCTVDWDAVNMTVVITTREYSLQMISDNREFNLEVGKLEDQYNILNVRAIDKEDGRRFLEEFYRLEAKYDFPCDSNFTYLAVRYSALYQTIIDFTLEITKNDNTQLQKAKSIYAWRASGLNNKSSSDVGELARSITLGTPLYVFYHNSGNCLYQAWLTQYMLDAVGIENKICSGDEGAGAGNGGTSHFWNYANLDGTWYFMDAYWELPGTDPDSWLYFSTTPFEDHMKFIGWDDDL